MRTTSCLQKPVIAMTSDTKTLAAVSTSIKQKEVRDQVDGQFREDLNDICDENPDFDQSACHSTATLYWAGVAFKAREGFASDECWIHPYDDPNLEIKFCW